MASRDTAGIEADRELERQIEELKKTAGERQGMSPRPSSRSDYEEANLNDAGGGIQEPYSVPARPGGAQQQAPFTADYIRLAFTDFIELHAIAPLATMRQSSAGWARLDDETAMGSGTRADATEGAVAPQLRHAAPEGYRKRFADELAEKFPSRDHLHRHLRARGQARREERGQSEAIVRESLRMSQLTVPIVATVIARADPAVRSRSVSRTVFSDGERSVPVISVEGCAAIL